MTKRLELTLPKDLFEKLDNFRNENNYLDNQDIIYEMLRNKFDKKSFHEKLKDLFR